MNLPNYADGKGVPELEKPKSLYEAARNGMRFFNQLQNEDGHFATEYGGELGRLYSFLCYSSQTGRRRMSLGRHGR